MAPFSRGGRLFPTRPELIEEVAPEIMTRWAQGGQLGCLFAQRMAQQPANYGWLTVALRGLHHGADLNTRLAPLLATAAAKYEALQLVFPERELNTVAGVVTLVNELCDDPAWYWEEIPHPADVKDPQDVLIGLRWRLPNTQCSSWILGFADLPSMPFTRRAPFLALAFRTKAAPTGDEDPKRAHLAHMDSRLDDANHKNVWAKTVETKKQLVDGELPHAARAKVTFCLPRRSLKRLCDSQVPQ